MAQNRIYSNANKNYKIIYQAVITRATGVGVRTCARETRVSATLALWYYV